MTLTVKTALFLTAATLTMAFNGISHAQSVAPGTTALPRSAVSEPLRAEVLQKAPKIETTRAASWQGKKVAVRGRDVVSYFNNDKPLKGSKDIVIDWDNTKWRFATEENAELFKQDPHKYIPEFGGFCPVALADNNAKIGKSSHYTVIDQKLYLNYNRASKIDFRERPDDFLLRATLNY